MLIASTLLIVVALSLLYDGLNRYMAFRRALASIGDFPGIRCALGVGSRLTFLIWDPIPFITPGRKFLFQGKYEFCMMFGADIFTLVSAFPRPRVTFYVADPVAAKTIALASSQFPKPIEIYKVLLFYGQNLVTAGHDEWKKLRKICAPSFSERNNKLVWIETIRIVNELFEGVWESRDEVEVEDVTEITSSIALFVIGNAAFGQRISWEEEGMRLPGFKMSFKEAIICMSAGLFLKATMPDWLLKLSPMKRVRDVPVAFQELKRYMEEMIDERRSSETADDKHDLLSSLVDASKSGMDEEPTLPDDELMGNVFVFLVAGHETTGHNVAFALALLALHQDEQEALYRETQRMCSNGQLPKSSDVNAYTYANAVFYESLRMFPPATNIPKYSVENTTLSTVNTAGNPVTLNVPQGAHVSIDTPAMHYNPRYWDDPHTFRPSRFLEDWPRDAFMPFSIGPRACIGRRFAEVEAIAVLVMFVSRYHINIKPDSRYTSESSEARRDRVLSALPGVTLTPKQVPLVFTRRKC